MSAVRATWPGEEERRFTAPAACLADDGWEIMRIGRNSVQLQVRCAWRVLVLGLSQMLESRGVGLIGALVSVLEAGRAGSSRTDGNHPVMKSYLVSASIFLVFEITHRFCGKYRSEASLFRYLHCFLCLIFCGTRQGRWGVVTVLTIYPAVPGGLPPSLVWMVHRVLVRGLG